MEIDAAIALLSALETDSCWLINSSEKSRILPVLAFQRDLNN